MQAPTAPLDIAGVGASAGGLEAMLPMFAHMKPTGRLAYVVAQHMARDGHDALVVRLMNRESTLPVVLAEHNATLTADTIYVIPSGKDGVVKGNMLALQEPLPTNLSTPSVNTLFASIAETGRSNAIGIVLSGTGADGTAGCRAIKAQGGTTIAQMPDEAKFDGMPTAAIDAKVVDEILPVTTIGLRLAARYPATALPPAEHSIPPETAGSPSGMLPLPPSVKDEDRIHFDQLLTLVHQATGIDFTSYKEDTLLRRLDKHMATLGIAGLAAYLALARKQPQELKTLQHLFLVSVSSFFRDAESFTVLKTALAKLVSDKPAGESIRVWVPGCASGEEALTLAILLRELAPGRPCEIFATDLNPDALALARAGSYRQTAFKEMDPRLRDAYFTAHGQHYVAKPDLLASIQYEQRDVLTGPPLTGLDLVSCRNLLIYMKSHLQDTLITSFHHALQYGGLLFIGQSESLSFIGNSLFAPIDHYHRLFRRRH